MFKFLIIFILVVGAVIGGLMFFGYEFHLENFKYYLPEKSAEAVYQVEFSNGRLITGKVVRETDESIRLNVNGLINTYPKTQIKSTKEVKSDFFKKALDNVKRQWKRRPLISKGKKGSAAGSLDKSSTSFLKTITQIDKIEQMEKVKKKIEDISKTQDERNKQVDELMTFTG